MTENRMCSRLDALLEFCSPNSIEVLYPAQYSSLQEALDREDSFYLGIQSEYIDIPQIQCYPKDLQPVFRHALRTQPFIFRIAVPRRFPVLPIAIHCISPIIHPHIAPLHRRCKYDIYSPVFDTSHVSSLALSTVIPPRPVCLTFDPQFNQGQASFSAALRSAAIGLFLMLNDEPDATDPLDIEAARIYREQGKEGLKAATINAISAQSQSLGG